MNMTPQQLQGAIRTLIAYIAGRIAGSGLADPMLIEAVTTIVVAAVGLWSIKSKPPAKPPLDDPPDHPNP